MQLGETLADNLAQALHALVLTGLKSHLGSVFRAQSQNLVERALFVVEQRQDLPATVAHGEHRICDNSFALFAGLACSGLCVGSVAAAVQRIEHGVVVGEFQA